MAFYTVAHMQLLSMANTAVFSSGPVLVAMAAFGRALAHGAWVWHGFDSESVISVMANNRLLNIGQQDSWEF